MDSQESWYASHLPRKGQIVVDVGANVGRLSQFFWEMGQRTTQVTSVEPLPVNAKAVETRIRRARAGSKWKLKRCAISSYEGHLAMRNLNAPWGVNGIVVDDPAEATLTVACRRLETLVPDATVVKIDVEGHEYEFLPQAVAAMQSVTAWAVEIHCVAGHRLEDMLALFANQGYRLIGAGRRRDEPDGEWVDVALTPDFSWDDVGGVPSMRDGLPSTFKMLHLIAIR